MTTIDSLILRLEADTVQLRGELSRAERSVKRTADRTDRSLRRFDRGFSRATRGVTAFGAAMGVAFGAAALRGAIQGTFADLARIGDTADKLGLTAEALQELRFAGKEVGVAVNTTDLAMQRFTRRLGEARQGSGELRGVIEQYDIALTNADGTTRSAIEVLGDLANATMNAGDEQEQLRIAFKAFDSEGAALVSVLRRGSAGLRELQRNARETGNVVREDLVKAAQETNREFERLAGTISTAFKSAVVEVFELLRGVREFGAELGRGLSGEPLEELNGRLDEAEAKLTELKAAAETAPPVFAQTIREQIAQWERVRDDIRQAMTHGGPGRGFVAAPAAGGGPPAAPQDPAAGRVVSQIDAMIMALEREVAILKVDEAARDALRASLEAEAIARETGVAVTEAQRAALEKLQAEKARLIAADQAVAEAEAAVNEMRREARATIEATLPPQQRFAAEVERLNLLLPALVEQLGSAAEAERVLAIATGQAREEMTRQIERGDEAMAASEQRAGTLSRGIVGGFRSAAGATDGLGDALGRLQQRLQDLIAELLIFGPLEQALRASFGGGAGGGGGGFGGIFSFFGSLFGGGGGSSSFLSTAATRTSIPGGIGGFAGGGNPPVGLPSIVGERGPELIVPKIPTTVLSASKTRNVLSAGGGAAGPALAVHMHNTFQGRFTAAERAENVRMAKAMARGVMAQYEADLERGGGRSQRSGRRPKR